IAPGISLDYIDKSLIPNDATIEVMLENPYPIMCFEGYDEFFDNLSIGMYDSMYHQMFDKKIGEVIIALIMSFLGILTFSLAGVLMRNSRLQNLSFALVAFFGGIYFLFDALNNYIPLIIDNPQLCFLIDESTVYFLALSFMFYVRSYLISKKQRDAFGLCLLLMLLITLGAYILHMLGIKDILKSEVMFIGVTAITSVIGLIFLVKQSLKDKDIQSKIVFASFIPMILFAFIDIINMFVEFMPSRIATNVGTFLTIIIQLVNLIISAKKSYEEQLNYEKVQSELLKSRVTIMISQIQPHFLYNSLTSIAQLCEKDPKRAKTATIDFANYLRGNMNSIKDEHPVPFETELSHLKTYLSLEKMRFGDDLNIVYDIGVTDFKILSLTVQPLVENAVKHGVGMKEDGGTVTISTREYDDRYEVVVSDDGVGFDTTKPNPDTSRTHLGIENIKERISTMCNGEVTIDSEVGKGTVSTIKIYKDNKEE
ncbi:sensor histidine kinase, partial [Ruminococcus sp.]|uniref:sensor histidine kinase n=1 Tax=Ruminococcus sp. TaxID=41978 RepID=UPI00386CAEE0